MNNEPFRSVFIFSDIALAWQANGDQFGAPGRNRPAHDPDTIRCAGFRYTNIASRLICLCRSRAAGRGGPAAPARTLPFPMTPTDRLDFALMREALYTAVLADVLDGLGYRDQVPSLELRRLSGDGVLIGRAKTTRWEEIHATDTAPYELELRAVDECQPNEIIVAAADGSLRSGIWGELLSTAAMRRGCVGALVDGAVRDVEKMHALGFAAFARGVCPRDSLHRQRVAAIDCAVSIGGVRIESGDLICADVDGVVVVPRAIEAQAVEAALTKVTAENRVRDEIRAGLSATEVFRKYGVL